LLSGKGFSKVYNLKGGIMAWDGDVADGPVGLNLDMITGEESPAEIIRLAYGMEHALGYFYRSVMETAEDEDLIQLLGVLADIEEKHKARLLEMYSEVEDTVLEARDFEEQVSTQTMEGGFNVSEFAEKNKQYTNSLSDILVLAMMLETQALDLYLRFAQKSENQSSRDVLFRIGDEEKGHLEALGKLKNEKG
jgi:sulfur-carrier protein adenylyltransferase/sulfurtransferase